MRFSVTDHGPGVPVTERERIFEKFYRLPGEPREGAGLGLAICREIVRAHDGQIGVTARRRWTRQRVFLRAPGCCLKSGGVPPFLS